MDNITSNEDYKNLFIELKEKIRSSQLIALRSVNKELINLYWEFGKTITSKQNEQGWGRSIVELLAKDLQRDFPGIKGFSPSNLWRMRNFYFAYQDSAKLAQLAREISWFHNVVILEKCKDSLEREYYMQMTRKFGWSRNILEHNISVSSYEKFLNNQTSFDKTLEEKYKHQAKLAVKDEYSFGFLEMGDEYSEHELETKLISNIRKFLLEMGGNFAFVGSQYRLEVDEREFFIDLLLYHRSLSCLVAIELKKGEFLPEYVGKMNFYLTALDRHVKLESENPSIGIIICKNKSRTIVEYTLQDTTKPMGVATYETKQSLPYNMKDKLPSVEDIIKSLEVFDNED